MRWRLAGRNLLERAPGINTPGEKEGNDWKEKLDCAMVSRKPQLSPEDPCYWDDPLESS